MKHASYQSPCQLSPANLWVSPPPKECREGQDGNVVPRLVTGNQIEPDH